MKASTQRRVKRDADKLEILQHELNEDINLEAISELESWIANMLFKLWVKNREAKNKLKVLNCERMIV